MAGPNDSIYCEVCELPHRVGVERCESCGHALGTAPDWTTLKAELPGLRMQAVTGSLATIGMLVLNVLLFGGAGYIVLLAPIGWAVTGIYRHRMIAARLRAAGVDPSR